MSKEICISSTPHETRLAILEDDQLTEIYYERENEYTLAGSIYKGRVTRVLPGMQSAFVDVGLERDAFLYVTDFLEEQEDSADFERLPASGGGGRKRSAATSGARAEAEESTASSEAPEAEGETASAHDAGEGTRRWRGRRGRRGRGLRRAPETGTSEASAAEPAAELEDHEGVPESHVREGKASASHSRHARTGASSFGPLSDSTPDALLLPGESLSKYGAAHTAATALAGRPELPAHNHDAESGPHSKPSTLIDAPIDWSGVGLLPGESRASAQLPGLSPRIDEPLPESSPVAEAREGATAVEEETASEEETPSIDAAAISEPEAPAAQSEDDASASHRVDLFPPSELRLFSRGHHPRTKRQPAAEAPSSTDATGAPESADAPASELSSDAHREDVHNPDLHEQGEHDTGEHNGHEARSPRDRFADLLTDLHSVSPEGLLEEEEVGNEEDFGSNPPSSAIDEREYDELEEQILDQEAVPRGEVGDLVRDTHLEKRVEASAAPVFNGDEVDGAELDIGEEEGSVEAAAETEEHEDHADGAGSEPVRRGRKDALRSGRLTRRNGRQRQSGRRPSAQTSDLPIISELLKQGQEILVQIAKEPIAKKGARITSHIALPGRFLVFMPTVNHVGVSRKISSDEERQRLKRILLSEKGEGSGGFIVRTAADGASEEDLRADIRFLISLWGEIRQRSEEASPPALIYHDLNLIERVLRDRVSDNFSAIWVDSESEYERIVRFLNRFQPSLVRRVKLYTKETPLFEQFGIQEEIGKALKSKVWLKSGGSIVINQTEALVAIDINTGKYVGKTARLEDTILRTNLDAIPEIVRQIRLRDLGGIIVIDFIDMDERRNRHKVMQALEEELKSDRAPSKVLQFNDFGLVAITRKRVKQSLERTLCVPCPTCTGTGMVKSPATVANEIYIEMRKMQRTFERRDVLLRVHPEVVKTLKAGSGRWLTEIEEMIGKTVLVKSDPSLPPEQFDIH